MNQGNLFRDLPTVPQPEEQVDRLTPPGPVRVERIVSTGQNSPPDFWYDQDEDEWVVLLSGSARLEYPDGSTQDLHHGDWVFLPAHCRHRVAATDPHQPTVWLAVFYPPAGVALASAP
jgi:cupin 2 domain-containing protein